MGAVAIPGLQATNGPPEVSGDRGRGVDRSANRPA